MCGSANSEPVYSSIGISMCHDFDKNDRFTFLNNQLKTSLIQRLNQIFHRSRSR